MSSLWKKQPVFIVVADNGEDYEDYSEGRLGIFYTREDAELYLKNAGWKFVDDPRVPRWAMVRRGYFEEVTCHAWIEEDYVSY